MNTEKDIKDLVIPNAIDGHPVTKIQSDAFSQDYVHSLSANKAKLSSVVIGDNVREIGSGAFFDQTMVTVAFGKSVETIGGGAFRRDSAPDTSLTITDWGNSLKDIQPLAFMGRNIVAMPILPDKVEEIGYFAFYSRLPETITFSQALQSVDREAFGFFGVKKLIILNKDFRWRLDGAVSMDSLEKGETVVYCYSGSLAETETQKRGYSYCLIDGDSLLWDGETIAGNVLPVRFGMTEEELRSHLSVDGASSEIQIDGLQDGKVVNGTTITLFHTVAQAPGKVYTVEKKAEPVSVSVETLPTKTNYFYKEAFDPSGLSLRVAYDDGTETVVTDGVACTGTDLIVGTNTITATYENCSTTFPVTVRYSWWQTLIRIFLFGFLWY